VSESEVNLVELVELITLVNRCWHTMRDRDANSAVTAALRDKKTALQVELLTRFPDKVSLVRHDDESRALYSLRLSSQIRLSSGEVRSDAMHLPVDLARDYLPYTELAPLLPGGAHDSQ